MARHNYNERPKPAWQDGYFIPPSPKPVDKHPDTWNWRDQIDSMLAMSRNPIIATTRITRQQPYVYLTMMGQTLLVPSDPELIKYLFVERGENYGLNSIRQAILKPILKNGLLTAEGPAWKRARRALSPLFTPRHTGSFAPTMKSTTQAVLTNLFEGKSHVDFSQSMLRLTYLILSETLFSGEIEEETEAVLHDVAIFINSLGKPDPLDILGAPSFIPRPTKLRGFSAIKRLRKMVRDLAQTRRAQIGSHHDIPDDFLTRLLKAEDKEGPLSDEEIEDHIVTFIGAGHETTSRAMTWMAYLLSQDKDARDKLEAEIDGLDMSLPPVQWADHLPWSMACFEETMRLYPPAPIISRYAKEADSYEEINIAQDASVMINLWALHRHETLWERPDMFYPARFYGKARDTINRFQYLPFGLGHRVCIGQKFAMQEAAILIAMIFKSYRFDYDGTVHPWPVMRITVQPEKGMPMSVTKR